MQAGHAKAAEAGAAAAEACRQAGEERQQAAHALAAQQATSQDLQRRLQSLQVQHISTVHESVCVSVRVA